MRRLVVKVSSSSCSASSRSSLRCMPTATHMSCRLTMFSRFVIPVGYKVPDCPLISHLSGNTEKPRTSPPKRILSRGAVRHLFRVLVENSMIVLYYSVANQCQSAVVSYALLRQVYCFSLLLPNAPPSHTIFSLQPNSFFPRF